MVPCSDRINPKDLHKVMDVLAELEPGYDEIIQTAIHTVKPDNIATFLGKRIAFRFEKGAGTNYARRLYGTFCYRHWHKHFFTKKFCHFAKKIVDKWPEKKFGLW